MISSRWDGSESTRGCSHHDGCEPGRGQQCCGPTWTDTQGPPCTKGCCAAQGTFQPNPSWAIPNSSQLTIWGMYQHVPFLVFRAQKEQTQHSLPKHHFSYIFLSHFFWGFSGIFGGGAISSTIHCLCFPRNVQPLFFPCHPECCWTRRTSTAVYIRSSSSHTGEDNSCAQLEPTAALHTPAAPEPTFSKEFSLSHSVPAAEWHWRFQCFHE